MPTEPTYNTGDAIDTALVRQNYGGPVGLTAESAVMGLCDEIDRLRLDLRSEQMERADAEREADRLRAEVYTATVANRITENHNHFDCAAEMTKLRIERDVLLADPAPVGLTEDERKHLDSTEFPHCPTCTAIIDRLSAPPVDDREREGEILLDGELTDLDPRGMVAFRRVADGILRVDHAAQLSPLPPDVVTLTLSYRGQEVSEEVSVDAWRDVAGRVQSVHPIGTPLIDACRALAEKVDADD